MVYVFSDWTQVGKYSEERGKIILIFDVEIVVETKCENEFWCERDSNWRRETVKKIN